MSNNSYIYNEFQLEEYMIDSLNICLSSNEISKEIVFLGDSLIRDYDLNRFFPTFRDKLFNCGVPGITTEGLFNILKQGVIRHNPKTIFILVGTNDMNKYVNKIDEEIIMNILTIIVKLKVILKNVNICLISILPCDENRYGSKITGGGRENLRIKKINEILGSFKEIFKNFLFIDVFDKLVDGNQNLVRDYTHDGLHLSSKGYEVLTSELEPILDRIINSDYGFNKFNYRNDFDFIGEIIEEIE